MLPSRTARTAASLRHVHQSAFVASLLLSCSLACGQTELKLQFAPASTTIKFTIGDILHTIHGSFQLKKGDIDYLVRDNAVRGVLVADAASGRSGNRLRDHRMQHVVLESERYPEIVFRPDRVDGTVTLTGTSNVQVHGIFAIHGTEHELTMPVRFEMFRDHWIADSHFNVPYVRWGMKNPSSVLLRVSESVEVDIHATGSNPFPTTASH